MQLRDYQQSAIDAINEAYARGVRRQLLEMATGAGKTVVFASLTSQWPGRALVVAHRDRLIAQAVEKLSAIIPWHRIGIVKAEQNQAGANVVVASVQTLQRSRRLAMMPTFDLVIVDEAHRSAAKTYRRILEHVCHKDTLLLGVTATPNRADGIGLNKVYEEIVYSVGLLELIDQGYLVPLRGRQITIDVDFSKLHTRTNAEGINDYKSDEVVDLMEAADWYKYATGAWIEHASDRRTIAFVPPGKDDDGRSTAMAFRLAEHMRECGIAALAINGETSLGEQRRAMADFEAGRIQVIVNCDLMVEGVDLPSADCALWARPTKSEIVYRQGIGRITRLSPATGKVDGLVLDLVGASNRLDLLTLGDLFGIKELKDGEEVREAIEREKIEKETAAAAEAEQQRLIEEEVRLRAQEVDLLNKRAMEQAEKEPFFKWRNYPEDKRGFLKVFNLEYQIWKDQGGKYHFHETGWRADFSGQAPTYTEAKKLVEDEARRRLFGHAPATEKQIQTLTKNRIPFDPHISKYEASALLQPLFDKWERQRKAREAAKNQKEVITI